MFGWVDDGDVRSVYATTVWPIVLLANQPTAPAAMRNAFTEAFEPIGFPPGRYWLPNLKDTETPNIVNPSNVPTLPRRADGDDVTGCVTLVDQANVIGTVGVDGMPVIRSKNTIVVPNRRAADIERALRAVVGYLSEVTAHDLGHLLGIACGSLAEDPDLFGESKKTIPTGGIEMPDGTVATAAMAQDPGGHDPIVSATGLMVDGALRPLGQMFRLKGRVRSFNADQRAHANVIFPRSSEMETQ